MWVEAWIMLQGLISMDESNREAKGETKLASETPSPRLKPTRIVIMAMPMMLVGLLIVSTCCYICCSNRLTESLRKEILGSTVEILDKVFRWNAYAARSLAGMLDKDLLGDGTSLESFSKIRAASFSIFKAIPLVTSIGATSVNGFTSLYVREGAAGSSSPVDRELVESAPVYIYSKSAGPRPPLYVETVDTVTGDAVGQPIEYQFRDEFKETKWFANALSVPLGEVSWHLSRSQTSGLPYIHSAVPVLTKQSKGVVTVVHCSYNADAITRHLSSSLDLQGGNVFVLNELGEVVFTSEGNYCMNNNISESRCKEAESNVVKGLRFLESRMQVNQLMRMEAHFSDVVLGGRRYTLESWPHSFEGVNLALVVVIPCHSSWGSVSYQKRVTWMAVTLLALGTSFLGCLWFSLLPGQVAGEMKLRAELQKETEARQRAEASRDAKTAFFSHMSHELRTPMACIIGLLDILMGELKMSEHQSSVRQVHRCATSLVALLNSALDIAKVEAGKLELEIAEFDLEHELTSLIEVFSVSCDAKGLHLALQLSDDIPKLLKGDSARVMQIFTNLIGNSIKFTSKGRIIVRGWVDTESEDNNISTSENEGNRFVKLKFEVDDTGPGIDTSLRERVFENFVQGAATVPRTHGGTGLGLGIVRSLVHLMGGEVKIGDKTGDGTVFQFFLRFELPAERKCSRYEVMKRREIILGMPDKDCRAVVAEWMEHRRLVVQQVGSWEDASLQLDIRGHLRSGRNIHENDIDSKISRLHKEAVVGEELSTKAQTSFCVHPRRTKSDTQLQKPVLILDVELLPRSTNEKDYIVALEKMGLLAKSSNRHQGEQIPENNRKFRTQSGNIHAVVWVLASNTPDCLKNVLGSLGRASCRSVLIRRPLHPSRLRELFKELESRERNFQPEARMAQNLKSLTVNIGKQLGVELYTDDEAPAVDTGEASPSNNEQEQNQSIPTSTSTSGRLGPVVSTEMQMPRNPLIRSHSDDAKKYIVESEMLLASKPLQGLNVLVAEDHVVLRMLASTLLKKLGATPFMACNGQEAVDAVVARYDTGKTPFDCILMDCQMPIMDGYDACNAVRLFEGDKKQRTCIIALTANAMASDEKRCFLVGMDAFLSKPMDQERLVQVLLKTVVPFFQTLGYEGKARTQCGARVLGLKTRLGKFATGDVHVFDAQELHQRSDKSVWPVKAQVAADCRSQTRTYQSTMSLLTSDLCDEHMDRIADGRVVVLAPVFKSYGKRLQFHGPVSTVKVFEDNTLVRKALEEPGAGKVLVVDGGGSLRCALLGGFLGTLACQNLWAGIIVNGCCRDVDEINATDIGVRALASHPLKSNKRGQGERDVPVLFGGCRIQPGDWCYVDNDGILISVGGEKLHNQRARV
ncbi:hypothetical protein R1flu_023652 [Riccia fluitans]|uniref:4-hydroxy-4-methyl-2-oxoglutarate aldolase n=1 Tax=Riccia fluitans TaxID=41844 RepID=A0ABD1XSM0_9MARC